MIFGYSTGQREPQARSVGFTSGHERIEQTAPNRGRCAGADEIEAATAGAENGVEIVEGLAGLGLEGWAGGVAGGGVDAGLAGDEEKTAGSYGL